MAYTRVSLLTVLCVLVCMLAVRGIPQKRSSRSKICGTPDNLRGICVHKSQCKSIMKFLTERKALTGQEESTIRAYDCGTSSTQEKICCPEGDFNLDWVYDSCRTPDKEVGKCKPLNACKPIWDYINNPSSFDQVREKILQEYVCKNSTSTELSVCCSNNMILNRYIDVKSETSVDHSKHRNIHLLPTKCGKRRYLYQDDKIYGGVPTMLFEFPWAVALKIKTGNSFGYDCGGSLISNRYILTAAHCIQEKTSQVVGVRLGEYDLQQNIDCLIIPGGPKYCAPPHEDFDIALNDTIVHPNYNPISYENDIALIRLRRPVNITDAITPVCLPITMAEKLNNVIEKLTFVVIGWGRIASGAKSNVLMKLHIQIGKCADGIPSNGHFCAGGRNEKDACHGDSGGPLMADHVFGRKIINVQYGIVSTGSFICAIENYPTTYTDVGAYMDWILDNLKP
ncbi:hypothetical protein Trydic_g15619 [Trypoxylus dichotomus]